MTTEDKLNCHLERIVMPLDVPLTANEALKLCDRANEWQRALALERARIHNPLVLPDEEQLALRWVKQT